MLPIRSQKQSNEHNPLPAHGFCAEPCALVYNGRVFLYLSSEKPKFDKYGKPRENKYDSSIAFRALSSTDLVNWIDHGELTAAGRKGVACWAKHAAAPCVVYRRENERDRFYMYFDDRAENIGVLVSDDPLGPFEDVLERPLVNRDTPGCADITWISDPAVVINSNRDAFLYFGGGTCGGDEETSPSAARAVKLGADMLSLASDSKALTLPYYYEDSCVNLIDGSYIYSYCTGWNIPTEAKERLGIGSARIVYAVSPDPFGPFELRGQFLKNPGEYFGCFGNSHHQLFEFSGRWYVAYQSLLRERAMGWTSNYRCAMLNEIERREDGGFNRVVGSKEGVGQISYVKPYLSVPAALASDFAGVEHVSEAEGLIATPSIRIECAGWIHISGVDFGECGGIRFHCKLRNTGKPGLLMVLPDSLNAVPMATLRVGRYTEWTERATELSESVTGVHELYLYSTTDRLELSEWRFTEATDVHTETHFETRANPIIPCDFPDPDVLRVNDTYYMVSTTMHFMPSCAILRSWNLLDWELIAHVAPTLEDTPAKRLEAGHSIYGQGMWAASLRYSLGTYYVCFVERDTGKTRLFRSHSIKGPWRSNEIEGYYYDSSLLFDDDGSAYIIYGHATIRITELNDELTAPRKNGLNRVLIREKDNDILPYEGAHMQKINGQYCLFLIHSLPQRWMRTQACFHSSTLRGRFTGGDVLSDDMGFFGQGVAQGGLVDTPLGGWYAMLFQDRGAVGRLPVLVPVRWENGFPIFGESGRVPSEVTVHVKGRAKLCASLYGSDRFNEPQLKPYWEWNHLPDNALWGLERDGLRLTTGTIAKRLTEARNTLTQRMVYPRCAAEVTIDASDMNDGDIAGLCALQGDYAWIGLVRENGVLTVRMLSKNGSDLKEEVCLPYGEPRARLRVDIDFTDLKDIATFSCRRDGRWVQLGEPHQLTFKLDHFTGCRFGLFALSTANPGGSALFSDFVYEAPQTALRSASLQP